MMPINNTKLRIEQKIPIYFELLVRDHSNDRRDDRFTGWDWECFFMDTDFGEVFFNALMQGKIKEGQRFLYANENKGSTSVLQYASARSKGNRLSFKLYIVSVIHRYYDRDYDSEGKLILHTNGKRPFKTSRAGVSDWGLQFYAVIPLTLEFNVYDKKGKIEKEAMQTLSSIGNNNGNYLNIAADVARKTLPQLFYKVINQTISSSDEFTCVDENSSIYATVRYVGYFPEQNNLLKFALKRFTSDGSQFDGMEIPQANDDIDNMLTNVKRGREDIFQNYSVIESVKISLNDLRFMINEIVKRLQ